MTNDNEKRVTMRMIDPVTGKQFTPEEQAATLADVRAAIRAGKLQFTVQVKQMLGLKGLTQEQIESWLAAKDS